MAGRLTDAQVADLPEILRSDCTVDAKVDAVAAVKSGIKQFNVPEANNTVPILFDALRAASSSQYASLANAGFTTLNHLITRLSLQEPKWLVKEAKNSLPLLVERLGDQKEKIRALALQSLKTLYGPAPVDTERAVRNLALIGKNPRGKEMGLQWLLELHQEENLAFKAYVPTLMELLEDADGMVRDAAKTTVIELFRQAPNPAKADLKRQLKNFKIRPAIEQAIVKELVPVSSAPASQPDAGLAASVSSLPGERPVTPMPADGRTEQLDPLYVNTQGELNDMFREMREVHFDGRETEQNWLKREESMTKLRRLMVGNAVSAEFQDVFLAGLKSMQDGIIKAIVSLRTSLSKEGCSLVQEMAGMFGPAIDSMVELYMQTFVKLSAATKKIIAQLANDTVNTIIATASYTPRLMQHISFACQDKNVQPRVFASGWLKTLLSRASLPKAQVEHAGGLDLVEKCLKKGLADPNPGVREKMRATYWTFAGIWPARAEAIMSGLDASAQKLLLRDPHNPNSPKKSEGAAGPPSRPGLHLSKSLMGGGPPKPSLRETVLAQKRALASKNVPSRPASAMATRSVPPRPGSAMAKMSDSPSRVPSNGSTASAATTKGAPVRQRPDTGGPSGGGLSAAPVRRKRVAEMVARPATAGPYSVRSHDQPSVERTSPSERSRAAVTPRTIAASPRLALPKRPGHVSTASESSIPSPILKSVLPLVPGFRATATSSIPSPRVSPAKSLLAAVASSSPAKPLEEMAVIAPSETTPVASRTTSSQSPRNVPGPALKVYEDPFTERDQKVPKSAVPGPVLGDKPVNEDAAHLRSPAAAVENGKAIELEKPSIPAVSSPPPMSPGKEQQASPSLGRQNARLLDSGISKVQQKSLDVHGFRKLQGIIRDSAKLPATLSVLTDDKFDALLMGLFGFLEATPQQLPAQLSPDKFQDVKAQILATIKLLLKGRLRECVGQHVAMGIGSLLRARAAYDSRTHIVSGMELLADELVRLGDPAELTSALLRDLSNIAATELAASACSSSPSSSSSSSSPPSSPAGDAPGDQQQEQDKAKAAAGRRCLSMGLHVLKEVVGGSTTRPRTDRDERDGGGFQPSGEQLAALTALAGRCLGSSDSGVRMDAVQLCVALHGRVGDARFWEYMKGTVADNPKNLITYYIARRQKERDAAAFGGAVAAA